MRIEHFSFTVEPEIFGAGRTLLRFRITDQYGQKIEFAHAYEERHEEAMLDRLFESALYSFKDHIKRQKARESGEGIEGFAKALAEGLANRERAGR